MENFETHPKDLWEDLLNLIHTREMALPDFQRDFVWQPGPTKALIISLAKRFPAGSLLRIESNHDGFAPRAFEGAPPLDGHQPKYLILDGQQRLTSLYQALYGTGDHLYFVNLQKLLESGDLEDAFFYESRKKEEKQKQYSSIESQGRQRVLPFREIFGGEGFHKWISKVARALKTTDAPLSEEEREELTDVYERYIDPIAKYRFPVVTLPSSTSLEAVCTIFETLNNTGVRLSVFDLLSARYYVRKVNLRQLWLDALDSSARLKSFDIDPYYVLQAISQLCTGSVKRGDVLKLKPEEVSSHWDDVAWGMSAALDMLLADCGVLRSELVPYSTMLVPLAALFATGRDLKGPAIGAFRSKIRRWYWCAVFSQKYESNPTSQATKDFNEIRAWLSGGPVPETISAFQFSADMLYMITTRQRAVYRGILGLILCQSPFDFYTASPLTSETIAKNSVEDHHIFPVAFLSGRSELKDEEINSVLNRTLIDQATNGSIGKNPPSVYLTRIEQHLGPQDLDRVLASHILPTGLTSSLRRDDFDAFRRERAQALFSLIQQATSTDSSIAPSGEWQDTAL